MKIILCLSILLASHVGFAQSEKMADRLFSQRDYLTTQGLEKLDDATDMYELLASQEKNAFKRAQFLCRAAEGIDVSGQVAYVVEVKVSRFQKAVQLTENALGNMGFLPLNPDSEKDFAVLPNENKKIVGECLYRHISSLGNASQILGVTPELQEKFVKELGFLLKAYPQAEYFGGLRVLGKLKIVFPDLVPGPKSAVQILTEALQYSMSPVPGVSRHILTHVYLAQALLQEGKINEARQTLQLAIAAPLTKVNPEFKAENKVFQINAAILLNQLQ